MSVHHAAGILTTRALVAGPVFLMRCNITHANRCVNALVYTPAICARDAPSEAFAGRSFAGRGIYRQGWISRKITSSKCGKL